MKIYLRKRVSAIGLAAACLTIGFAWGQETPQRVYDEVVAANNRFALKFIRASFRNSEGKNVISAPAGVSEVFGLLVNGSSGKGREELETAFELQGIALEDVNRGNAALRAIRKPKLPQPAKKTKTEPGPPVFAPLAPSFTLRAAMWFPENFPTREFQRINRESYGVDVIRKRPTSGSIDGWLGRKEQSKFNSKLAATRDFSIVAQTSFSSPWSAPFSAQSTHPGIFKLANSSSRPVSLMHREGEFSYLKGENFQAVVLGFEGSVMYLFLPNEDSSVGQFIDSLSYDNWNKWMSGFHQNQGLVELPRFSVGTNQNNKRILEAMGVHAAFTDLSTFEPMAGPSGAILTGAEEISSIEVNEEGAKSKSTLIISGAIGGICGDCPPPPPPFRMIVDRPFFFAIVDQKTNEIMFVGAIVDPEKAVAPGASRYISVR